MAWQGVTILCIALLAGHANAREARMVHGKDAKVKDFPYQAAIRYNNAFLCGGAIISEKHVITTAHCIIENNQVLPYKSISVVTGTSYIQGKGHSHNIAKITVHPKYVYDGTKVANDIAVVTLEDVIVFDNKQQKINLPEQNFKVGDVAHVTGWGSLQTLPIVYSKKLQVIETKLSTKEECQKRVLNPRYMKIDDTVVCTRRKNQAGPCFGDSGSPLVVNGELVGIVSWIGGLVCGAGYPDVYTNVYVHKDFINSVIN